MSKAGKGLISGVRSLLEEWSSFGRPACNIAVEGNYDDARNSGLTSTHSHNLLKELQRLRREAAELKEEVEAIKAAREQLKLNQEAIVLAQLKGALRHMQNASHNLDQQKHLVQDVVEKLGEQAAAVQEAALEMKALKATEELLKKVDVGKYVRERAALEDCLRPGSIGKEESASREESLPEKG